MRTNAKKLLVQHSPHKRMSKPSAGYSLVAWMNVHPHRYDCERIFLLSTDSRRIAFAEHTPHKRMKANAVCLHIHITSFAFVSHLRTDMDAALYFKRIKTQAEIKSREVNHSKNSPLKGPQPAVACNSCEGIGRIKCHNFVFYDIILKIAVFLEKFFSNKIYSFYNFLQNRSLQKIWYLVPSYNHGTSMLRIVIH